MEIEFSRQIFDKYPIIKFHENPSSGSRVVPCGRTERLDETNSRFSQFCEKRLNMKIRIVCTVFTVLIQRDCRTTLSEPSSSQPTKTRKALSEDR
jgi:hypothetical protein